MVDAQYINPRLAAVYDVECGWSADRQFYLELAGKPPQDIVDFGCGTGLIANAYARAGHRVVGVDPAPAMLDLARKSELGQQITWVEADSQTFRSDTQFDLIIMTGHVFQVLLEPADVLATFNSARGLLKPGGRFVFETRNPGRDWMTRWNHERNFETAFGPLHIVRRVLKNEQDRIWFDTQYNFTDGDFTSRSILRFWTQSEIVALIKEAGLDVAAFYGDWDQSAFDENQSDEMIFIVEPMK